MYLSQNVTFDLLNASKTNCPSSETSSQITECDVQQSKCLAAQMSVGQMLENPLCEKTIDSFLSSRKKKFLTAISQLPFHAAWKKIGRSKEKKSLWIKMLKCKSLETKDFFRRNDPIHQSSGRHPKFFLRETRKQEKNFLPENNFSTHFWKIFSKNFEKFYVRQKKFIFIRTLWFVDDK